MTEQGRIISPESVDDSEQNFDDNIRPQSLGQFVGQRKTRERLSIFASAAKRRSEALDHVLIFGPPGLGKTTLAHILAHEMSVELVQTSGPALDKPGDVASILTRLQKGAILFVDEIHRLKPVVEEVLYPAMEDYRMDVITGQGLGARSISLALNPFTLVGATTRKGLLTSPLRDRFGIVEHLDYYSVDELSQILHRSAGILEIQADEQGVVALAERSRGTPRIANRLLRRVRDFAQVKSAGRIDRDTALDALAMMNVDDCGLDVLDRKLLMILLTHYDGGPVGVDTLAAALSEERGTIEDTIEPFLLQQGFLERTPRGRAATLKAWKHMGIDHIQPNQGSLI